MRPPLAASIVTLLLLTSGCLGGSGPDRAPSDDRALNALEESRAAVADLTSYRTSLEARVVASAEDEQITLHLSGDVLVNASLRRMNATAEVDTQSAQVRDAESQMAFIDEFTAYNECGRMGWERQNLSRSEAWLTYTPIGQQLATLNRTNVYWRGSETVDGQNASVIVGYPTEEDLQAVPNVRGTGVTESIDSAAIENVTVTVWIDAETDRPIKATRDVKVRKDGNTATANGTFQFDGFDEPTPVTLPEIDEDVVWKSGCPG